MSPVLPPTLVLALAVLPSLIELPAAPVSLTEAGVWLGWLGSGLLSANLVLMVREPAFAAWFGGLERMYRWHHALGTTGYGILLAHPLVLAGASFPYDPEAAWQTLSPFAQPWPIALGWVALIFLMAGLAATFAVRLRYSLWLPLHTALSVGVILGIVHVLAVGGTSAAALPVIVPAVVALGWRVLRTDRGGNARPFQVVAVAHPSERFTEAALRPLAMPLAVSPGQFVMAAFFEGPRFRGCGEYHPYTVSRLEADGSLVLSIKALGDCTRHIQALEEGVACRVQGPYGTFLAHRPEAPELWIAGGIGITPFLALLRTAPVMRPTELFYLYRDPRTAPYLDELAGIASEQPLVRFRPLLMQEDPAPLLAMVEAVSDLAARHIYLCGPPPLVDAVARWLRQRHVPPDHIHFERFDFR